MELSFDRVGMARAVLIAGPTASGKSRAALGLADEAQRSGRAAWIINADSMQVYDALRVLTARPTEEDEARALHRLYGHVAASERYSAGAWLKDAGAVMEQARAKAALPIIAGGTGLYFTALTEGLAAIPDIPRDIRARWTALLEAEGAKRLHAELARRDSVTAERLRPNDTQRVLRALEVVEATGIGLVAWQASQAQTPLLSAAEVASFVIEPSRAELYGRIEERVDGMVAAGALAEVEGLLALHLPPDLPVMKAIGVVPLARVLSGAISMEAATAEMKTETRRYAKRQLTWFRNQMAGWPRIST
jgi:tRNA dimethylallyltransferase